MEKLPFIPNHIYKRSTLHDQYGGSRQSGISPTANYPYIFIFSGKQGKQHGYKDSWENKYVFSFTGEGQSGDMTFSRGNLALRDHQKNGNRVFLFEYVRRGFVKFVSELSLIDFDYFETHDIKGRIRIGIKFFFKIAGLDLGIRFDDRVIFNSQTDIQKPTADDKTKIKNYLKPNVTERSGLVNTRVGQGAYRKSILHRWEYKCAVTKFNDLRILIASHIVPWRDSTDKERLDVENGILLSPTYDGLFDQHLITFSKNGNFELSNSIETTAYQKIGVTGTEKIENISECMMGYLIKHHEQFQSNLLQ